MSKSPPIPFTPTLPSPTLIGREHVTASITHLLQVAGQTDIPRVTLITGEAGIGKSRVVAALKAFASNNRNLILSGNAFEQDRGLPYAALGELLANAKHSLSKQDQSHVEQAQRLLAALSAPTHRASVGAQAAQRRFFDALLDILIAEERRHILFILEDLQWADEPTLECMLYLVRRTALLPILFIGTLRTDAINPALEHMLAELERARAMIEFPLARLTLEQTEQMIRAIFHPTPPVRSEFAQAIYTLTDGNPFFIEEVCKGLVHSGDIFVTLGGWSRKTLVEMQIPRTVQDAVQQRMQALSPLARQVLPRAAVIGRRFSFALLENLMQMDESELLPSVKELLAVQLLVEESADQLAFQHELTRQAAYSSLLLRERRTLHREVAEIIERMADAHGLDARAGELAFHFDQAQQWQKAFEYALRAGEQARALYAPHAAIEQYSRALHAARQLEKSPPVGVLRARGNAFETIGDFDSARADLEAVLAQAHELRDRYSEWQGALDLGFLWIGRDLRHAGEYFQRALELARELDNPTALAQTLNRLGNWHMMIEQPLEARRYHGEALELFRELQDQRGLAETLDLLGTMAISADQVAEGTEYYAQAIELFRRLDDRSGLGSALTMSAFGTRQYFSSVYAMPPHDRSTEALALAKEALRLIRETGWRAGESLVQTLIGMIYAARGEYGQGLPALQSGIQIAREIGHQQWLVTSYLALGGFYLDILQSDAAQTHLEQALLAAKATGSLYWTRAATGLLASAYVAQAELNKAQMVLDEIQTPDMPALTMGERHLWTARAELVLARQDFDAALVILEQLSRAGGAVKYGENAVPRLALIRAQALEQLGQRDGAEQVLLDTLTVSLAQNTPPMTWRIHAALARLNDRTGRQEQARQHAQSAESIIEMLTDSITDPTLAAQFLQRATKTLPYAKATVLQLGQHKNPGGLSTREQEVAILIAQGKSNRAIAAELVLSERTVEKHVENIMAKLEFDARTQIAAWAVENGLKS